MARTDARAVHGFDEALARCRDFEAEGADIIFLEAPETEDEMRQFCPAMNKPCMANLVPGGKTPVLPPAQLQEVGYKLALYPVMLMSSAIAAMQATLAALQPGSKRRHRRACRSSICRASSVFPTTGSGRRSTRPRSEGSNAEVTRISAARRRLLIIEDFSMYSRAERLSAAVRRIASSDCFAFRDRAR